MLGGTLGSIAHHYFPAHVATPGAYALVGMGAAFAGIVRAPMTSVVMIFEVTRDYAVIVPLMISNLLSYFIASRLRRTPVYEALAEQDGIHLPLAETRFGARKRQVVVVMRPLNDVLHPSESVQVALEKIGASGQQTWVVRNGTEVMGIVTREQLQEASREEVPAKTVGDLIQDAEFPHLHSDHSFDYALARMGETHTDLLPVVSRANVHELVGVVRLQDVLESYGFKGQNAN
jgi:CIC family chloride channel protein